MAPGSGYNRLFFVSIVCLVLVLIISENDIDDADASENWLNHGGDIYNSRYARKEKIISPSTVSKLQLKWEFYAGRDITATPAIFDGILYFPCWNGFLYSVKADDGSLLWKQHLQELTGFEFNPNADSNNVTTIVSRATPTVAGDLLIISLYGPGAIVAVERTTGKLVWSTIIDSHPQAQITMSGTVHKRGFYVGVSSAEEGLPIGQCCTFRGNFLKLDIQTGAILWRTYMLPDNYDQRGGYAGAAIWGSSPSIDLHRNLVYIATGNLYSVPPNIEQCQEKENNQTVPTNNDKCIEPDNHSDSILALDLETGKIKWYNQIGGYDVWYYACRDLSTPNCPPGPNPDADFGEAPMLISIKVNDIVQDLVVAVQKSGFAWALDRDNGSIVWSTEAGPGGVSGGGTWGAATDAKRVYTNIANSNNLNFTLKPSKTVTTFGGWVAMDACSGTILWSTANPSNATVGPVTIANGVLFGGSTYKTGPIYAINAMTGEILWSRNSGATVFGGMSVSEGCVYFGHGYRVAVGVLNPTFSAGTSLFAYCV